MNKKLLVLLSMNCIAYASGDVGTGDLKGTLSQEVKTQSSCTDCGGGNGDSSPQGAGGAGAEYSPEGYGGNGATNNAQGES